MVQAILEAWPAAALTALVIWLPMLGGDSAATAAEAARGVPDPRARHFYDGERGTGRSFAARLGGEGRAAWDVYLVYPPGMRWTAGAPPLPAEWMHQLEGSSWADAAHYHAGDDLSVALHRAVGRLTARPDRSPGASDSGGGV